MIDHLEELEEEFPSNSKSSRVAPIRSRSGKRKIREEGELIPEPKKVNPVIPVGRAVRQKKTLSRSIAKTFFGDEAKDVVEYVLYDVLIPAAKNTIQEVFSSGIEMFLFGETRSRSRSRNRDRGHSTVSYGSYYRDRDEERRPAPRHRSRGRRFDLDEIVFEHGDEASEVLEALCDNLEKYEQVTVADFYELAGIDGGTWADQKWGWEDLRRAYCTHTRGGWMIVFPDPIELD